MILTPPFEIIQIHLKWTFEEMAYKYVGPLLALKGPPPFPFSQGEGFGLVRVSHDRDGDERLSPFLLSTSLSLFLFLFLFLFLLWGWWRRMRAMRNNSETVISVYFWWLLFWYWMNIQAWNKKMCACFLLFIKG